MIINRQFFTHVLPDVQWATSKEPVFEKFTYDSRLMQPGGTFVALLGERVDGHDFIDDALKRGAVSLILDRAKKDVLKNIDAKKLHDISIALVENPERALIALATAWRQQFMCPVVGVTGSIGKTTTKELIVTMARLSGKKCLATLGNHNTAVSISCTLLALDHSYDCAVIEMGINKQGEMAQLAALVKPTLAVITTIAHSHMEGLGSYTDIAAEKRDIFKYFKADNIGIVNGDLPLLSAIAYHHPVVKFGYKTVNQVQARKVAITGTSIQCTLKIYNERHAITLPTMHSGKLTNSLAAAATAYFLQVPSSVIVQAIQQDNVVVGRFQPCNLRAKKGIVINDCYNANPESMKEALVAFERLEANKKIAVLGDMFELGVSTAFWHRHLGRLLRKAPSLQHVILVGKHVKDVEKTMPRGLSCTIVENWQEAIPVVEQRLEDGIAVLVKGSNGVGLKNVVEKIAVV